MVTRQVSYTLFQAVHELGILVCALFYDVASVRILRRNRFATGNGKVSVYKSAYRHCSDTMQSMVCDI